MHVMGDEEFGAKALRRELAWAAEDRRGACGGSGQGGLACAVLGEVAESRARTQELLAALSAASTRPPSARPSS
eukprot:CAMPEP_0202837454 /NCGR_PEP_ID=MMETSP1389-20130828/45862_1 /ASSEMBLY_ACC=CAM_ASM_000865 /TAXON_ID=302021 /ORGANISM="Rhodomonas sp., Strain CCMP768" /LENGTH=73 /DNA_ID=CAMNT_0049513519 /DNA_START=38 /DNA_END=257 /DNA_ORIENTATION=-